MTALSDFGHNLLIDRKITYKVFIEIMDEHRPQAVDIVKFIIDRQDISHTSNTSDINISIAHK